MSKDETDLPTIAYMCGAADARDDCRKVIEAQAARIAVLEGVLREIGEMSKRRQLPLTHQINDITLAALQEERKDNRNE